MRSQIVFALFLNVVAASAYADDKYEPLLISACKLEQAEFEQAAMAKPCTQLDGNQDIHSAVSRIRQRRMEKELISFVNEVGWTRRLPDAINEMAPHFGVADDMFLAANLYLIFNPTKYKLNNHFPDTPYGRPTFNYRFVKLGHAAFACPDLPAYEPSADCRRVVGKSISKIE